MESAQPPPRRQAAISARRNLAESSSDEGQHPSNESDGYHATPRAGRSKSRRNGKGSKVHMKKRTEAEPQVVEGGIADSKGRKRKRDTPSIPRPMKKRQRSTSAGSHSEIESDLTPLSTSDDEQEEMEPSAKPLVDFPREFANLSSNSKRKQSDGTRPVALPDLDDDSDDLPDIGLVLSQQGLSARKGKKPWKLPVSLRKHKPKSQEGPPHGDNYSPFASSPTLPPSSLPSSSLRRSLDDGLTTEANIYDQSELYTLSDDSDLELDAVSVDELCLARGKANESVYWPAKVLEVKKSPTTVEGKARQKKMYRVLFLDKKEKDIPRDWFYISSQEEFCSCTIGRFESSHIDVVNDFDEDSRQASATNGPKKLSSVPLRSPSPVDNFSPSLLPSPDYCDLPLPHQFAYVTPILQAVMNEKAIWALRRHEMYLKGGVTRDKLKTEGGLRGAVDAKDADDFSHLVQKWCLGVRGRDFVGDEDEERYSEPHATVQGPAQDVHGGAPTEPVFNEHLQETSVSTDVFAQGTAILTSSSGSGELAARSSEVEEPPESEPTETESDSPALSSSLSRRTIIQEDGFIPRHTRLRQHGSPGYENLSPHDKVVYCLEVLLPEALNQILLWRTAERKFVEVMWDNVEEEERLHERGEQLLRETDWVMDIMRLRSALASTSRKGPKGGNMGRGSVTSEQDTTLRRTRSGRVGSIVGSYKE